MNLLLTMVLAASANVAGATAQSTNVTNEVIRESRMPERAQIVDEEDYRKVILSQAKRRDPATPMRIKPGQKPARKAK